MLEVDGLLERTHYTGKRGRERAYKVERFSQTQNDRLYDTHYLRGSSGNEKAYKRVGGDDGERHRKNWVAYYETGEEHPQAPPARGARKPLEGGWWVALLQPLERARPSRRARANPHEH